jgi:hypothetical protein
MGSHNHRPTTLDLVYLVVPGLLPESYRLRIGSRVTLRIFVSPTKNSFQLDEVSAGPWRRPLTNGLQELLEKAFVHGGKEALHT